VLIYLDYKINIQYKNNIKEEYSILITSIKLIIKHFKLSLILINSLPLSLLPPLYYISLIDLIKERYYPPLIIVLLINSCLL
jgi:hypothetical protein